jgi:hypothetical protein
MEEEKERVEAEVGRHLTQLEMLQVGRGSREYSGGLLNIMLDLYI